MSQSDFAAQGAFLTSVACHCSTRTQNTTVSTHATTTCHMRDIHVLPATIKPERVTIGVCCVKITWGRFAFIGGHHIINATSITSSVQEGSSTSEILKFLFSKFGCTVVLFQAYFVLQFGDDFEGY